MNIARMLLAGIVLISGSCRKKAERNFREATHFTITSAQTPLTVPQGGTIVARVASYGANACYEFSQMEVATTAAREFSVRSVGTVLRGNVACAEMLVQVDTTVSIPAPAAGQYILRYLNGTVLFRADTVQVN